MALSYPSNQASTYPCPHILLLLHPSFKQLGGLGNTYFFRNAKISLIESMKKSDNTLYVAEVLRPSKLRTLPALGPFLEFPYRVF